jgi:hypothetical protein
MVFGFIPECRSASLRNERSASAESPAVELPAPVAGQKRELIVWIWYPATPKTTTRPAEYQPAPWRNAVAREQGLVMTKFFTRDLALVRAHSFVDAEVSPAQHTYPVVL